MKSIGILTAIAISAIALFGGSSSAQAAACAPVTDVDTRGLVYSGRISSWSVSLSWQHSPFYVQQLYTVEKSIDGGGTWAPVATATTLKSISDTGTSGYVAGTIYRLSTVGCDTAGPVVTFTTPAPAPGVTYWNQDIY